MNVSVYKVYNYSYYSLEFIFIVYTGIKLYDRIWVGMSSTREYLQGIIIELFYSSVLNRVYKYFFQTFYGGNLNEIYIIWLII